MLANKEIDMDKFIIDSHGLLWFSEEKNVVILSNYDYHRNPFFNFEFAYIVMIYIIIYRLYAFLTLGAVLVFATMALQGCSEYVQNVQPFTIVGSNLVNDSEANTERAVPYFLNGQKAQFALIYLQYAAFGDALSDAFEYSGVTARQQLQLSGGFVGGGIGAAGDAGRHIMVYPNLYALRYLSDTTYNRLPNIPFSPISSSQELRRQAYYTTLFYRAAVRYFLATYIGIEPTRGGGVLMPRGPFVPSDVLYRDAIRLLDSAELFCQVNSRELRRTQTFKARMYIMLGEYAAAEVTASRGMMMGEVFDNDGFVPLSDWNTSMAFGFSPAQRFYDYAAVSKIDSLRLRPLMQRVATGDTIRQQTRFALYRSMPFLTWRENTLILAECALRRGDEHEALRYINQVRNSYSTPTVPSENLLRADMETIIKERDIEFFAMGLRLADQRRFNRWHLPSGTWQYLPIPQLERELNPNLQP